MLRPAELTDAGLIVDIRKSAILAQPETIWTRAELERAANFYNVDYIIKNFSLHECYIYDDKAFVAFKDNYLASLFIRPEAQNKGIGAMLLNHAEERISPNHEFIWLFAHSYAESFYEKHGYLKQAETDSPFGIVLNKYQKSFK